MDKETVKKIAEKIVGVLLLIAVAVGIFYYMMHHNEYSSATMAEDAKKLVDKMMSQNDLPYRCVKISNLPDKTLAMGKQYDLVAELDNGEKLPIRFKRYTENGKIVHSVEVIKK